MKENESNDTLSGPERSRGLVKKIIATFYRRFDYTQPHLKDSRSQLRARILEILCPLRNALSIDSLHYHQMQRTLEECGMKFQLSSAFRPST